VTKSTFPLGTEFLVNGYQVKRSEDKGVGFYTSEERLPLSVLAVPLSFAWDSDMIGE
jgi:hypothetical protein